MGGGIMVDSVALLLIAVVSFMLGLFIGMDFILHKVLTGKWNVSKMKLWIDRRDKNNG